LQQYLKDRFTRERFSHAMQDSEDIQDDGDMQDSKTVRWLEYKRRQMQRKNLAEV